MNNSQLLIDATSLHDECVSYINNAALPLIRQSSIRNSINERMFSMYKTLSFCVSDSLASSCQNDIAQYCERQTIIDISTEHKQLHNDVIVSLVKLRDATHMLQTHYVTHYDNISV